jgi:hypothetical protein
VAGRVTAVVRARHARFGTMRPALCAVDVVLAAAHCVVSFDDYPVGDVGPDSSAAGSAAGATEAGAQVSWAKLA